MRLLIIGSLDGQIGAASRIAIGRGAQVAHADDIEAGLRHLRSGQGADLVMIDVRMDVAALVRSLASERIVVPVVAAGIGTDADAAVRAIKAGAREYVPLPPDPEMIAAVLAAATTVSHRIVFRDPRMAETLRLADQVAASDATILISGESGTGKELMARYLHRKSRRAEKRFVAINCAAIPDNLLESELFGHEKGAFTGAVARRIGKFEEANGGTLLLDEVSEMDPRLQAKLLRVIQEREIDRVGGNQPVAVDVRLLATSNTDMAEAVRAGTFRDDLYFRLNVVNLHIPPLRERPRDVDALAEHFVAVYSEQNDIPLRPLSGEAREKLLGHGWPGNVRELENTIHRAVLLAEGAEISAAAVMLTGETVLSGAPRAGAEAGRGGGAVAAGASAVARSFVGRTVAEVERDLILETLQHCLGNRTHAANILGISIRTLRNKLKLYSEEGVPVPMPGEAERPTL
ncbi:MAG: sigma-54-dependent Fis family transcriptional regulator [Proteobacteria bacterium]|nr:sigma-54-dependent Fis family transcriptional regulator [Pseudomonadota bacterium]